MTVLRTDIERALDELASQEEGMRFQGLAVVLGKMRWPELIARQRKKDFGLDAYARASLTPEGVGKGLAASITPTLKKISGDAGNAKESFSDLRMLLFVTSAKVGNADRKRWEEAIYKDYGLELHILEREEIITQMMMPENASLRASFLHLDIDAEPQVADFIERTRRAADAVTQTWALRTKGLPLIELTSVRLDPDGAESTDILSLAQIDLALSQSRRVVLEGPAGGGKTTVLIQLAQSVRTAGIPFIIELPAWVSSRRPILEYIAGMPAFQAESLTPANLALVQQTEPFLLLLNGWNEITASNSEEAVSALRELERDFPRAGIIVATRTHYLAPPLPGALRLRLLRLRRDQRAAYLTERFGEKGEDFRARLDADPSLDELTRTPFILSEVGSLFEVDAEIPSTKIGVLAQVLHLQEQRDEHRNALQVAPILGLHTDYLKALATEMTRRGAIALAEADARAVAAAVVRGLVSRGQIEPTGAPSVLAMLSAHHILVRLDYPQSVFQFEHHQLQEYYATIDVRIRLLDLQDADREATDHFIAEYVNDPAWAEPLRMIAETFAEQTCDVEIDNRNIRAGGRLVEMALAVDPVFAGELAKLCGEAVWNDISAVVGKRFRAIYAIRDSNYQQYALAAMLASGSDDFCDIILPLLSGQDKQTRLRTYHLWPDIQVSSLGSNWREQVHGWSEEAQADFVSQLLYYRTDDEIVAFAVNGVSSIVKKAAVSGLIWTGSDAALTRVLESMDAQTFEDAVHRNADLMPVALRPRIVSAMHKFIKGSTDHSARLRTALHLIEFGETGLDDVLKDSMAELDGDTLHNLWPHIINPGLECLHKIDPVWTSEWVANQVGEGGLYWRENWLPFATAIPDDLVEKYLHDLETVDLGRRSIDGMIAIISAYADTALAARMFAKLRELQCKMDAETSVQHEFEWQLMRQLGDAFRNLPDDVAVAGILASVTDNDLLDIKVTTDLLSRVARSDIEPFCITDYDLKERIRTYLKNSVAVILNQNDFNGEEKANLASAIAQVGKPDDMEDLVILIRADIERMRRSRAARDAGDHGPLSAGGTMCYAGWHTNAVLSLDSVSAEQVLIDLLPEPEYQSEVASAMARDFVPKSRRFFSKAFRYDLMWNAREGRKTPPDDEHRRIRFATALNAEIKRLREQNQDGMPVSGLKDLAKALAAIDGHDSATVVLNEIAMPGQWGHYTCLYAAELLLMAGVIPPAETVFALLDSILERIEKWGQGPDSFLLSRILALCPLIDDPAKGISKLRDVLSIRQLSGHELRLVITALGESRSDAAIDLLYELASDNRLPKQCEDYIISAITTLDSPCAHELLLGFVDPDIRGIQLTRFPPHGDVLIARLAELTRYSPEMATRLRELCEYDLPELNREILSKVMDWIGTHDVLTANLSLIDDTNPTPVPRGTWEQLENVFVERRPYGQETRVFTLHARESNEFRRRLLKMAVYDEKRRISAFKLLGQIEVWRLEYGRPTCEPRHPDLESGQSWPPNEP